MEKENKTNKGDKEIKLKILQDYIDDPESPTVTKEEYIDALHTISIYRMQLESELKQIKQISPFLLIDKDTTLENSNCSPNLKSSLNRLENNRMYYGSPISDISKISFNEFKNTRLVGKKTIQELEELCFYTGIKLLP